MTWIIFTIVKQIPGSWERYKRHSFKQFNTMGGEYTIHQHFWVHALQYVLYLFAIYQKTMVEDYQTYNYIIRLFYIHVSLSWLSGSTWFTVEGGGGGGVIECLRPFQKVKYFSAVNYQLMIPPGLIKRSYWMLCFFFFLASLLFFCDL